MSEKPRTGTTAKTGSIELGDEQNQPQGVDGQQAEKTEQQRVFENWIRTEDSLDSRYWRPARTLEKERNDSDETEEDPERVVLFEDIKYNMFVISEERNQLELIFGFLRFLGIDGVSSLAKSSNHPDRKQEMIEREDVGDLFSILDSFAEPRQEDTMDVECSDKSKSAAEKQRDVALLHEWEKMPGPIKHKAKLAFIRFSPSLSFSFSY